MLHKLFTLAFGGVLTVLATGCIVGVEPETAINPVGTDHTVTVTLRDEDEFTEEAFCNILERALEDLEDVLEEEGIPTDGNPCDELPLSLAQEPSDAEFTIISGPNAGLRSDEDGVCEPVDCVRDANDQVSWTYESNGIPGTDVIEVCATFIPEVIIPGDNVSATSHLTPDELAELFVEAFVNAINEEFDTDFENEDEFRCQQVTKTWREAQRDVPNIGAGLSGLFAGQPTPLPTAAAPAPAVTAPSQGIRPPNTGDAGLAN
jgi:hypothetical protein